MKRKVIAASVIGLLSLCVYSCNNQDTASTPPAEQTTEVKSADTTTAVAAPAKVDTPAVQQEAPKVVEEKKAEVAKVVAKKVEEPKADAIDASVANEGKELIAKSDCLACHKIQEKLIGPSYADVAAKYSYSKSTVQNLASKVISGGAGVWGQTPMTPHPNVTSENAQKMVTYILSLKK